LAIERRGEDPATKRTPVASGEVLVVIKRDFAELASEKDSWPDCGYVAGLQHALCGLEPLRAGHRVVVQQRHHVSARACDTGVHATRKALVLRQSKDLHPWASVRCDRATQRTVVDQDDFISLPDN
jgi:hypothetical protein